MRRAGGPCPCCGNASRGKLCPACINAQIFARPEGAESLAGLRERRAALLTQLEARLEQQAGAQRQRVARWQALQELKAARAQAARAKEALARAQQQLAALGASNAARRRAVDELAASLAAARQSVLGVTLPTVLRYQSLTLSHVGAMLAREQRHKLRELSEVFPLRINAVRTAGGPIQITVANLRLPDSGAAPPGGWPEPQATSAALGYLLLLVDQVSLIMGGPVLHESAHQASTSSIWTPAGFWDRRPPSAGAMLPLHVAAPGGGAAGGAGPAAYASTTGRYLAGASFWGPRGDAPGGGAAGLAASTASAAAAAAYAGAAAAAAALGRATGLEAGGGAAPGAAPSAAGGPGGGGGGAGGSGGARGGRPPDFKAAWDLLQRSLACFLKDKAAHNGMQLPAAWNPLAWLVVYCAVVKRDAKQDGKLVAASAQADAAAAAAAARRRRAARRRGGRGAGGGRRRRAPLGGHHGWTGLEEDDEDEEDDGWGVVQAPYLPPPPSQPDAVEHWARAMYADGNARGARRPGASAPGRGAAGLARLGSASGAALGSSPGAGGMLPMERIRSLFGNGAPARLGPRLTRSPAPQAFQGRRGRAYLFNSVVNVSLGPKEDRMLITGLHTVADIFCTVCNTNLGWKYEMAFEEGQKYKEGKFILEKTNLLKDGQWQHSLRSGGPGAAAPPPRLPTTSTTSSTTAAARAMAAAAPVAAADPAPRPPSEADPADELFEVVDADGMPLRVVRRAEVHAAGLLHRAVYVWLFDRAGRLLLQRRAPEKKIGGGQWDLSVAEHLAVGESFRDAAVRGLAEELGVPGAAAAALPAAPLCPAHRRSLLVPGPPRYEDNELVVSYALRGFDGEVSANPAEVAEVRWVSPAALVDEIAAAPDAFTQWCREELELLCQIGSFGDPGLN
ncbi:ypel3 [Scenedesmus sp. PABB004]|nr:ypel3 [Scenedesmus sp. PABB004]